MQKALIDVERSIKTITNLPEGSKKARKQSYHAI